MRLLFALAGIATGLAGLAGSAHAGTICYNTWIQDKGWDVPGGERCDDQESGDLTGSGKRVEGIWIRSSSARICYKVHMQGIGWGPTACDGTFAGTKGESRRVEAIHIWAENLPADRSVEYKSYLQDTRWESLYRYDGTMSGTTGQSRRLERIRIRLSPRRVCPDAYYNFNAGGFQMSAFKSAEDASGVATCTGFIGFPSGNGAFVQEQLRNDFTRRTEDNWTTVTTVGGSTLFLAFDRVNNIYAGWHLNPWGTWTWMGVANKFFQGGVP